MRFAQQLHQLQRKPYIGFILPGFILYTAFLIVPLGTAVYYSFFDWSGVGPMVPVGFANYRKLLFDPRVSHIVFHALGNNAKFLGCVLFIIMPLQLAMAYVIDAKVRGYRAFQLVIFLPYVISPAIIGFFSLLIFDPVLGILNNLFHSIGLDSLAGAWFGNPKLAFPLIVMMIAWQAIGSGMLIFLANLKQVPGEVIEASIIDGAGGARRFFSVVVPYLSPSFTNNIVLGTIWAMTQFEIPYIVGGPQGGIGNSMDFMNLVFYRYAFSGSYVGETAMGFASSISVVLFLIILVVAAVQLRLLRRLDTGDEL